MFFRKRRMAAVILALTILIQSMPFTAISVSAETPAKVTFEAKQIGGISSTANSTGIEIRFNKAVPNLKAENVLVSKITGEATRGAVRQEAGNLFIVNLDNITAQGDVRVAIVNLAGHEVDPFYLEIPVYKDLRTATVTPSSKTYDTAVAGYDNGTMEQIFTIENTGPVAITGLSASLAKGNALFWIRAGMNENLAPNGKTEIGVRPLPGLAANATHTDTLIITGSNGFKREISLSFKVEAAPTFTATLSPSGTSFTFNAAKEAYSNANMAQKFTITNTGTGTINGLRAFLMTGQLTAADLNQSLVHENGTAFEMNILLSASTVNKGSNATVSVRPIGGLVEGTYKDTLVIMDDNGIGHAVVLNFTVTKDKTYKAEVDVKSHTYEKRVAGYDNGDMEKIFTVTNTGSMEITGLTAALGKGNDFFWIRPDMLTSNLAPGGTTTIGVRPHRDLAVSGTAYTDKLHIMGDSGINLTVDLSFTVRDELSYSISVDVDPNLVFTTAEEGYKNPALEKKVTIKNTGNEKITNFKVYTDPNLFNITPAVPASLNPNATFTVNIRPKEGLKIGDYNDTLMIEGDEISTERVALWFSVVKKLVHSATVDPGSKIFPAAQAGYNHTPMTQTFTIENTGTEMINGLTASLKTTHFEIAENLSAKNIAAGQTAKVTVRPKKGLAVSKTAYTDTLTVKSSDGIELTASLSFMVGILYGDLNGDGQVNSSDLILMLRLFTQPNVSVNLTAADVNADGKLDTADLVLFLKYFTQPGIILGPL